MPERHMIIGDAIIRFGKARPTRVSCGPHGPVLRRAGRGACRFGSTAPAKTGTCAIIVAGTEKLRVGPASGVGRMRRPTARRRHEIFIMRGFSNTLPSSVTSILQLVFISNFPVVSTLCICHALQSHAHPVRKAGADE